MEYNPVIRFLKYIGAILIILSIIEFLFISLLAITKVYIDMKSILLINVILSSDNFQFSGTVLFIFVIISIFLFMIIGSYLFNTAINKKIQTKELAKYLVVVGMIIVLNAFVKMNYLVLLGKAKIETLSGTMRFQYAIINPDISPFSSTVFWVYFISINCCYMITGVILATVGVKWTILIQEEQSLNA